MKLSPYWQTAPQPIPALEREWVEGLLAAMALAPDTRDDYTNQPVGMICGIARPEYGPAIYDLQCQICEATWSGIPGDPCWWCERSIEIQLEHQAELLLTPPDVDRDDINYEAKMRGWSERLARGVKAEIITEQQARNASRAADRRAV